MKRIITLLFSVTLFMSACASPTDSTSAPTEQTGSAPTSQPVEVDTATPEPTIPPTPLPPAARWYWAVDSDTAKVITVNQFGERRELGQLDQADYLHTTATSLDADRAILFLDTDNALRVYLLTPDGAQKIKLPSEPYYFNAEFSEVGRAVVAVHDDYAVFTFVTKGAYQSQTVGAVDTGPVFLVGLKSLTANLIDKEANLDPLDVNRLWFHKSKNGRYLRYLNGNADAEKMEIRELDLVTGEARTIYTAKGPPARLYTSPEGDLWYLRREGLILDLNGNQTDFTDMAQMLSPLKDGKVLVYSWNCVDNCEIKVFSPFGNDAALSYNLPWTIENATSYIKVRQLLPDQSLLFAGLPYVQLSNPPAIMETFPDLKEMDASLFRLTPDGQAHLVGIYEEGIFTSNVSPNGQFILMKSTDHTSFFIYDAVADRPLFSMPIDTELEDYLTTIRFFDNGIVVNLSASVPGTKHSVYRNFYYVYYHETSTALNWEDVNFEITGCPDLLEDGTLICWFYRTDTSNFDLARFDPVSETKTTLLENVWMIDSLP